eukprot:CAMPEP_0178449622 /NCGR_PEP_ID=MMETSP0689_2-20121128/42659_1 /TAXON_ID=160604 /ORGANISM="Amphidinium massartii, Strain CS-259" /LENGTH=113 /DNA_ID=CAMNT_0020074973 /DNA_START=130 /DNA_END=472 /DNA_ORIENTATION=+
MPLGKLTNFAWLEAVEVFQKREEETKTAEFCPCFAAVNKCLWKKRRQKSLRASKVAARSSDPVQPVFAPTKASILAATKLGMRERLSTRCWLQSNPWMSSRVSSAGSRTPPQA